MFTIVTPTMWRAATVYVEFLRDLVELDIVSEIIIINNDSSRTPQDEILKNPKIKIYDFGRNIFVNPAWNFGVKISKNEYVCILGDDLIFDVRLFHRVARMMGPNVGSIGLHHGEVKFNQIPVTTGTIEIIPHSPGMDLFGFGCLMFVKKSEWRDIPESLEIFCGDAFIFDRSIWTGKKNYLITNMMHKATFGTTAKEIANGYLEKEGPLYEEMRTRWQDYIQPNKKISDQEKILTDCFVFEDDLDLLEKRLNFLDNYVDKFIILESNLSTSGVHKPMYYADNKKRFKKYAEKIIYIPCVFDLSKINPLEEIEKIKNEYINKSIDLLINDSYIMIGNIDEIPNPDAIEFAKKQLFKQTPMACFLMKHFYYNDNFLANDRWCGTIFTIKDQVKKLGYDWFKDKTESIPQIQGGGWKISYFESPENILKKIRNSADTTIEKIKYCISNGVDLFNNNIRFFKVSKGYFHQSFLDIFLPDKEKIENLSIPIDQSPNQRSNFMEKLLGNIPDNFHIVELGSSDGSNTLDILKITNNKEKIKLDCIDSWVKTEKDLNPVLKNFILIDGVSYTEFLEKIEPFVGKINIEREHPHRAHKKYHDNSVDFIYLNEIDDDVFLPTIQHWLPKLKINGKISGKNWTSKTKKETIKNIFSEESLIISDDNWTYTKN